MKTFACYLCNSVKPCILSGFLDTDVDPKVCVLDGIEARWQRVTGVDNLTPYEPDLPIKN